MRNPDEFDEFYKTSRDRLLLQTFALTGDLRASRSAVRDAFVLAWHHWRKVKRQPDREAWLRPHAWADARRRHNARIWHRDRSLDPETKSTLDALGKLNVQQRRILVLTQLSATPMDDISREVGVAVDDAERLLQAATASYAVHRRTASSPLRAELTALGAVTDAARLPRASIIRRAGSARRRAFTAVGVGGSVVALLGAGTFVTDQAGVSPSLGDEPIMTTPGRPDSTDSADLTLASDQLLTAEQVGRLASGPWEATEGVANTEGSGINMPCQGDRFADPAGLSSMVRRFMHTESKGHPDIGAVQSTELSRNPRTAASTYTTTVGWYAGCTTPGVHLISSYDVTGVGDGASLFVLRRTGYATTSTYTVAVARTGQVTTTVFNAIAEVRQPPLTQMKTLISAAVNSLCGTPGAGTCAGGPTLTAAPPPPVGDVPGMLDVVDLAPPGTVIRPWGATEAKRAIVNVATVACDGTEFHRKPVTGDMTRSYLILKAGLPKRFGVTETVGRLPSANEARAFVNGVRKRMAKCEDNFLASQVRELTDHKDTQTEMAAWHISTEVSDEGTVDVLMAIVRRGQYVGQIGFVTARDASYNRATFLALAQRAIERLAYLAPAKSS